MANAALNYVAQQKNRNKTKNKNRENEDFKRLSFVFEIATDCYSFYAFIRHFVHKIPNVLYFRLVLGGIADFRFIFARSA